MLGDMGVLGPFILIGLMTPDVPRCGLGEGEFLLTCGITICSNCCKLLILLGPAG